jgi:hypothetical protein
MYKLRAFAISASLVASFSIQTCEAAPFKVPDAGLMLEIPPGWVRIPSDVLEETQQKMQQLVPAAKRINYSYGFQFGSVDQWFSYPYILVEIKRTGRIAESEFHKLDKVSTTEMTDKVQGLVRGIATDLAVGKMRYDESTKTVWITTGSNLSGVGRVSGTTAVIPTEYGSIQLHGYSREQDYLGFVTVFYDIVRNVRLDEGTKYESRIADKIPFISSIDWASAASTGIIGAAIGVLMFVSKKRSSKKKDL